MSTPAGETAASLRFADLGLPPAVMAAVDAVGYESPSPIQEWAWPIGELRHPIRELPHPIRELRHAMGEWRHVTGE